MAGITVNGFGKLDRQLEGIRDRLRDIGRQEAFWGSAAVHASYVEHGTSQRAARPFVGPAAERTKALWDGGRLVPLAEDAIREGSNLALAVAQVAEEQTREVIDEKGLIDTGELRRSITSAETEPELVDRSRAQI